MKPIWRIALVLVAFGCVLVALWGIAHLFTANSLFARSIAWLDSDVRDYERFPKRAILNAPPVFEFLSPGSTENQLYAPVFETITFTRRDGVTKTENLDQFLEKNNTAAFIVIKDDILLYERYFNGYNHDSIVTSFSVAKSFGSALVGIAISEGLIHSLEDPLTKYIPELSQKDPRFQEIRLRHLVSMSSGIHYAEIGLPWSDDAATYYAPDLRKVALSSFIDRPPGEEFLYNNFHPLLIGMVLERVSGMPVAEYLQEKIWKPLGMEAPGSWSLDSERSGFEKMESGLNARAIDFARFGRLYLNSGNWNGVQIIPGSWVAESTGLDTTTDPVDFYQYFWWVDTKNPARHAFYAAGKHGQYIYVVPGQNLLIVRFGKTDPLGIFPQVFGTITDKITAVAR